jgi:hypothetical protein
VSELTLDQLAKILRGDISNWHDVGGADVPINVYSRDNNSGTYAFIKELILNGADYTSHAQTLPGTAAVYDAVAKDARGIGYGGIGYNKGVKLLKLKRDAASPGLLPTEVNVDNNTYPLSRTLNYYLNPRSTNDDALKFIDWVRSPAGQKIVVKSNYYALLENVPGGKGTVALGNGAVPAPANPAANALSPALSNLPPVSPPAPNSPAVAGVPAAPSSTPASSAPANANGSPPDSGQGASAVSEAKLNDLQNRMSRLEAELTRRAADLDAREARLAAREQALNQREAAQTQPTQLAPTNATPSSPSPGQSP